MFGINAELLIDHAWGWEPCRMQDIKAYRPETNSICSGQVLQCPYSFEKARLVVREMAEAPVQFNLFDNVEVQEQRLREEEAKLKRERKIQEAMLDIKKKFGKNAILNGGSYLGGATAKERNEQIGGHKA